MRTVKLDSDSYTLPSRWQELTTNDIVTLAKLYLQSNNYVKLKVVFCLYLMGLRLKYANPVDIDGDKCYYIKHSNRRVYLLGLEQIHQIVSGVEWIFYNEDTPEGRRISINPRLTANPFRRLKVRFSTLVGPDDALGDISFLEFAFAETYLYRYAKSQNKHWLDMFIATLWRPVKNGNRVEFDQQKIEQWAKRTARIKPAVALAMQWYYAGCKYFLSRKYPKVFTPTGSGGSGDPFEGYMDLTGTLAKSDPTKFADVHNANLYFTLISLEQMLEAAKPKQ